MPEPIPQLDQLVVTDLSREKNFELACTTEFSGTKTLQD